MTSFACATRLVATDDTKPAFRPTAVPPPRPPRVLVVDDDIDLRAAAAELLRFEGLDVVEAENGLDALLHLRGPSPWPDVVLLDLSMPVMTGWEFREAQLREPGLAEIPVVILSSRAREAPSAAEVLSKSCAPEQVVAAIRRAMRRAEAVES
jgi:CheY-like chemotaxis protein